MSDGSEFYDTIVESDLFYSYIEKPSTETKNFLNEYYEFRQHDIPAHVRFANVGRGVLMTVCIFDDDGVLHRYTGYPPVGRIQESIDDIIEIHKQNKQELIAVFTSYRRLMND